VIVIGMHVESGAQYKFNSLFSYQFIVKLVSELIAKWVCD